MRVPDKSVEPDRYPITPFAARWENVLRRAMDEGGWRCVYFEPRRGKTTRNDAIEEFEEEAGNR